MALVSHVQTGLIHVERVRVFHDELAHAQQAGLRARLIAKLGLDLVPDLRQLLIAAQLAARDYSHDFFVCHAQAQVTAETVLEPEEVFAHYVPAARLLPYLGRIERREQHFLAADGVHFLAHDAR